MPKILVIDDEPGIIFSIEHVFEGKGIEVLGAEDGETGLRLAAGCVLLGAVVGLGVEGVTVEALRDVEWGVDCTRVRVDERSRHRFAISPTWRGSSGRRRCRSG